MKFWKSRAAFHHERLDGTGWIDARIVTETDACFRNMV